MGHIRWHYSKAFWHTLFFYWDWNKRLWWKMILLHHCFLMAIFGHLPIRIRGFGYFTYEDYQDEETGEWRKAKWRHWFPDITIR